MDDEEDEVQFTVSQTYVPEDADEWRRQWCVIIACEYFSGGGHDKVVQKAGEIEHYLINGVTRLKALK